MTNNDQRCFLVNYSTHDGKKFLNFSHLTHASSRKDAENATRYLEEPNRIRINRVVPINPESFGDTENA